MKENKIIKFKKDFLIGSATSGPQTEGMHNLDGKSDSVWDEWFKKEPERFFDKNFVIGDIRNSFKEYIDKASELNLNSLRTSIQWSRLMPDGKSISQTAKEFYRKYFSYIKSKGMKVMVNIHHFDMPMWLLDKGGFENKEGIKKYVEYAKKCFELFGDIVDFWFTFNEPLVPVEMGYMNNFHLPGIVDIKKGMQVMHNSLIAHMETVKLFRTMDLNSKIGIILNITPVMPRSNSKEDLLAAQYAEDFLYKGFLDPIYNGHLPKLLTKHAENNGYMWDITDEEKELINSKQGVDILGLNYYQPRRVKAIDKFSIFNIHKSFEGQLFDIYKYPKAIINEHRGWEIYPKGIYDMLINIKDNYGNPRSFIAENGMGVENEDIFKKNGIINDDYRISFYKEHLSWLNKAIREGGNCIGYHIWTFVDNWSWLNAYKNRYGVVELNIKNKKMQNKKSFEWFKELATKKEFYE